MTRAIQQRVRFNVSPARLFNIYMDSRQHSAATQAKAVVSRKVGGKFSAFEGTLSGKMLAVGWWLTGGSTQTWVSPATAAGLPPISTVATPGPVMVPP